MPPLPQGEREPTEFVESSLAQTQKCASLLPRALYNRRHDLLDGRRYGEEAAIAAVLAEEHQADRRIAAAVTRDGDRAAIEKIDDGRITQHQHVDAAERVVGLELR